MDNAQRTPSPSPSGQQSSQPEPSMNFVYRHWRGEYPLGFSYWFFGVTLDVLFYSASLAAREMLFPAGSYESQAAGTYDLIIFGTVLLIAVWQYVGIWRSANLHAIRRRTLGRSAFWALAAKASIIIKIASLSYQIIAHPTAFGL